MSEFVEFVKEVFKPFGTVVARAMFGGHGLYVDSLMFGLTVDDVLYLKVDRASIALFEAQGLTPFTYNHGDKIIKMSYYLAPEVIYDEPAEAVKWEKLAAEAAYRSKKQRNRQN